MRRLQKAHSREQPGFGIGSRVWLGTQSSLQTVRRSNRPNSRTLQAHHLKSMTKKTTLKELGEMLAHVVKHTATKEDIVDLRKTMATKDDIANLGGQLTSVERELKSIRRDLDDLREKVENVSGFQKEIDHALERIAAIEKHLGLDKKIAA
jgi:predicted  nucleic acid-binding Zn-ribbon protein